MTAVVGGSIALPALRLRGLYLALATLAFGVFVSDMIIADIAPHVFPIFHWSYSIFPNGTLQIPPLEAGTDRSQFVEDIPHHGDLHLHSDRHRADRTAAQQLRAAPDSHEGQSGRGGHAGAEPDQVEAFGVHDLGGDRRARLACCCRAHRWSVNADTFIIFISLALVMLTVVGGIGNVTGALMGGILAGTAFPALTSTFFNLEHGRRRRRILERHGQPLPGGAGTDRREPRPQPERSRSRYRGPLQAALAGQGRAPSSV